MAGAGLWLTDIASVNSLGSPLLSTHWVVRSLAIGKGAAYNSTLFDNAWLKTHVESIDMPFPYFDITDVHIQASKTYFPGFNNVNSTVLTLYEDNQGTTLDRVLKWQNLILESGAGYEGCYTLPDVYKARLEASLLSDITGNIVTTAILSGIWPTQIEPLALTSTEERLSLKVTLSVDSCKIERPITR
jgi:hypothetical protein